VSVMGREADRVADHSHRVLLHNGSHQGSEGQWPWVMNMPRVRPDTTVGDVVRHRTYV